MKSLPIPKYRNPTRLVLLVLSLCLFSGLAHSFAQDTNAIASDAIHAASAVAEPTSDVAAEPAAKNATERIDAVFASIVDVMASVLFFPIGPFPAIIIILVSGGIFFTFFYGFINLRLFGHAIDCVRGKFDNPDDEGEISHFKALTSALSATVGLGNIAGVAVAISVGGPGAIFWMWLVAFFGMTSKFSSCTLAQIYRRIDDRGRVLGGPMVYLDDGIKSHIPSLAILGKIFGILFALLCIGGSLGAGNLFQGKMTYAISARVIPGLAGPGAAYIFGIVLAILVGLVIIGGIRRIGTVTSKLVPGMCIFYCLVCLIIILSNYTKVLPLLGSIFTEAFNQNSAFGGLIGALLQGMKRAAFSNEAGLGSAAIAHAAAKTKEPVREGLVAMLGPFIDTIVVCTMTALAILITGVHETSGDVAGTLGGAMLTAEAFGSVHHLFEVLLVPAVAVFAFSTMISWSYYGERCAEYLCGTAGILPYRILFTIAVALGPILPFVAILDFSDMLLFGMAGPNIIGSIILAPVVLPLLKSYIKRYKAGEMKMFK